MITSGITIHAPVEEIWQAITDKNHMREWYFDIPDFELKEGSVFNFFEPGGRNQFHHRCEILTVEENRKFSHTWTHPSLTQGSSVVTWSLVPLDENKTQVTLTHEGVESFADSGNMFLPENYQLGWDGFMYALKNYIYGIRRISFSLDIDATPEQVWDAMWTDENYRNWASVFHEGTYMAGDLEAGERVHFLTPNGEGMASDVVFFEPNEFVLFRQMAVVENFEEQEMTEESEKWLGAFESYRLDAVEGKTVLTAELDSTEEHKDYFRDVMPKALRKIQEMAEKR